MGGPLRKKEGGKKKNPSIPRTQHKSVMGVELTKAFIGT